MTGSPPLLVLAADHTGALARSLEGRLDVMGAGDAPAAVRAARERRPAVALVHGDLPPEGGVPLVARMVALGVPTALALATVDGPAVTAALRAGVRTLVDLRDEPRRLVRACEAAHREELLLSPAALDRLRDLLDEEGGHRRPFPDLSPRERDVLAELAGGGDARRIASRLGLTPKTVRNHLARIQAKLGVEDRVQAALLARRAGLAPRRTAPGVGA